MAPPSSHPRHSSPPTSSDETTPRSEDEDGGVSTDVFADFDIQSDTDRAFLRAHLREAPKEDVTFLLNTRKAPQEAKPVHTKPFPSTPKSQARNILPGTPRSLLKYHQRAAIIAEFAKKHAAETIPGIPNASQLAGFLEEVQTFAIGLELGPNQALFEAKHAQEELCKAKGIKLESKLAAIEMPGLDLTDAIEVLASVQQTVGNLFNASGVPQDKGAAQSATPTKRKRFRKEANTPKIESDIGGTPLSETVITDSQPEKVMLNDRRSKRQKANIAAAAAEAEFAKLNPGAPKLSRRERKAAFIQNKAKEASANTPAVAPTTIIAAAVTAEAELSELDPEAPKLTRRERKIAFIQNKAKAASANTPTVAPTAVIATATTAETELNELDPVTPKLGRRERKLAFIQNIQKAKEASAIRPPVAPATVVATTDTQADPATNTQIPQIEAKEYTAVPVISPLAGGATLSGAGTTAAPKSKKMLKKEERRAKRALERQAMGVELPSVAEGDKPAPPNPIITTPTEQVNAADAPTPATIKADNEVPTEKFLKKRKRGAKTKSNPGPADSTSGNTTPVVSQTKPAATAVDKSKLNDTANGSKSKVAAPILPPAIKPPTVAVPNAPKPVVAAEDGFIDLRAPKKKKRARKSTTATDGGSNLNTSELVKTEAIIKPEVIVPVEAGKTEPEAEAKPIVKEEANDGDVGMNAAGKRKRKRSAQQAKKEGLDANEQIPANTPVIVAVPEPMELCTDEPASVPVAAPIIPATQPLSEIAAPNPVSNKRRKRGNRKSVGDENKTESLVAVSELKEHHS